MGDFIGFTFGGKHIKDLGVTRVSEGDRYEEEIFPELKDRTTEVPGLDGSYYFGAEYGPKKFDLSIAYDHLTEGQFRELRQTFGRKDIKELIFDERPYKKYMAKVESPIELSFVCFDERKRRIVGTEEGDERYGVRVVNRIPQTITEDSGDALVGEALVGDDSTPVGETTEHTITVIERERIYPYETLEGTERIYKGEGKISFICYYPFAKSVYKQLPTEEEESDWAISSGILTADEYVGYDTYNNGIIKLYNPGDLDTGFRLYIPAGALSNSTTIDYKPDGSTTEASLVIKEITSMKTDVNSEIIDVGVLVDTLNGLIIGVESFDATNHTYITSNNIYNEFVDSGYFFHIYPCGANDNAKLQITNGSNGIEIFYDYLYF